MSSVHQHYKTFWTPAYWQAYCEGHPVRRYRGEREQQLMLELLSVEDGHRVLEAGCGYGRLSRSLLSHRRIRWTGVELSPTMARHSREQLPGTPPVLRADISHLPLASNTFDRVLCSGVLMHLEDESRALAELVRVTRPGGLLVLSGNNLFHPLGLVVHLRALLRRNYVQRFHFPAFYRRQLQGLGCRVEAVRGDTLLGVGVGLFGRVILPPQWALPLVRKGDEWGKSLLPHFGYELWFRAVKLGTAPS